MPSFFEIDPPVLEKKIFEGFLPYILFIDKRTVIRSCDLQKGNKLVYLPAAVLATQSLFTNLNSNHMCNLVLQQKLN